MRRVSFLRNPLATKIGDNVEQFLQILGGPACIFLDGENTEQTRAFVTLLHGNEPSGVMALFRWLKSARRPAVNIECIVASVPAALETSLFSYRTLAGARDLNRCFRPPFDDTQGHLAEEILEILKMHHPEAVIDMNGDLLASLYCPKCDESEPVLSSLGKVSQRQGRCPRCEQDRVAEMFHTIDGRESFLDRTLGEIGVQDRDRSGRLDAAELDRVLVDVHVGPGEVDSVDAPLEVDRALLLDQREGRVLEIHADHLPIGERDELGARGGMLGTSQHGQGDE